MKKNSEIDKLIFDKDQVQLMPSWYLTQRQLCDLELLLNGGFSPLAGFMNRHDYTQTLATMRLTNGVLWPIPITLDVSNHFADQVNIGDLIALRDHEGLMIAAMEITDKWIPDKEAEVISVYGTTNTEHHGVNYLLNTAGEVYLGGRVKGLDLPFHYDFRHLRHTPEQLRALFNKLNWTRVVAFQTRNPMHRAHLELTRRAAKCCNAKLLIHPSVGMTKYGDIDYFTRVRCYEKLLLKYPEKTTCLSLLPLAMRMAGPREALWHAIIRKNYGCTHFIVGRDHAGPGIDSQGKSFYAPYAAQELVAKHEDEIGIKMVPFAEMVYVKSKGEYHPINEVTDRQDILTISGTELRYRLEQGLDIPPWFTFPEIITELRKIYPLKKQQGFTVFFTGLSCAGKSTLANGLMIKLLESGERTVTLLDGDLVRKNLSSELGFSKEHRDLNVLRIGYVASEITKHRGIAICAPIAPYKETRQKVREMVSGYGGYIEVYVNTPLTICEQRDCKGLYAKARSGLIPQFTGISDPYEEPEHADLIIDTQNFSPEQCVQMIWSKLQSLGYL